MGAKAIPYPSTAPTETELDDITNKITNLLTTALETVGRVPRGGGHSGHWWTDDCQKAHQAFCRARRHIERHRWSQLDEYADYYKVIRREKRSYWQNRIDKATCEDDLYKIVQWHKLGPATRSPPLVVECD